MSEPTFHNVYIGQGGNSLTCVMATADLRTLQELLAVGAPFTVFVRQDNGNRLTQLTAVPSQGGLVLHVSPPTRIPLDKAGNVAQNQNQIATWLEPGEQARGELKALRWGLLGQALHRGEPEAPQAAPVPTTPPPGPA